jgi:hypothetical protein
LRLDEFRVLQKGLELHDQGTLEYYRVFDGTKVDIVRKHVGAIGAISPRQAADAHQDDAHKLSRGPSRDANGGGPMERPRSAAGQPPAARRPNSADPLRPRREAPAANAPMRNLDAAAASRPLRSVDGNHQGGKANPSSSNAHRYPSTGGPGRDPGARTMPPLPRPSSAPDLWDSPRGDESDNDELNESRTLRTVAKNVAKLRRDISSATTAARDAQAHETTDVWAKRVATAEERLRRSEERNELANQRIAELENTVRRYQQLMKRVATSFPGVL